MLQAVNDTGMQGHNLVKLVLLLLLLLLSKLLLFLSAVMLVMGVTLLLFSLPNEPVNDSNNTARLPICILQHAMVYNLLFYLR